MSNPATDKDWRHPTAVAGITGAFLFVDLPGRSGQFTPGFDLAGVLMGVVAVNMENLGQQRGLDFIGENTGIKRVVIPTNVGIYLNRSPRKGDYSPLSRG